MSEGKYNFEKLIDKIKNVETSKRFEYLTNFFVSKNRKNYEIDDDSPVEYKLVIKYLFSSHIDIERRAYSALDKYNLCSEAMLIIYSISDAAYAYSYFKYYYDLKDEFPRFDDFERRAYLIILDLYVEFAIDIGNYTLAQKVEHLLMMFAKQNEEKQIDRLAYILYMKEDADEMFKLYCDANAYSIESYILLMLTLLKHDEELKTKEVLKDFLDKYEYGKYLGRIWDLDEDDKKGLEFFDIVDSCYEEILSVPDFFATIAEMTNSIIDI